MHGVWQAPFEFEQVFVLNVKVPTFNANPNKSLCQHKVEEAIWEMRKELNHSFLDIHPSQKDGQSQLDFAQNMSGVFIMMKFLACHTDEMDQICGMLNALSTPHPFDKHSLPVNWQCRMLGHAKRITGKKR